MPDIDRPIEIDAPAERVYEALTTSDGVRKWWTRTADLESEIGGAGEFRFNACRTITMVRIDELQPPARVAWTATSSDAPGGWNGTTIAFDLRVEGSSHSLLLFNAFDVPGAVP